MNDKANNANKFTLEDFEGLETVQKSPKASLKEFLLKSVEDEPFLIVIPGDEADGAYYLHCMRVELSRFRAKIIQRGGIPIKFKIMCPSIVIKEVEDTEFCAITLVRTIKVKTPDPDLDDLIDVLTIKVDE